jgi:hypothetical protein
MDSSFHSCDSDECSTETVSNKTEPRLSICCQEEEVSDDEKDDEPEEVEEQLEDENVAALESSEISDDLENRQLDATSGCEANSEFEILDCTDTYFIPTTTKEKERVKGSSLLVAAVPTSPILKNWSI